MRLSKFQPLTLIVPDEWSSKLSQLGHTMAVFPVAPRFAKMLCLSHQSSLLNYTVAIVAALSVQEFLLAGDKRWLKVWRQWAGVGNSLLLGNSCTTHCYKFVFLKVLSTVLSIQVSRLTQSLNKQDQYFFISLPIIIFISNSFGCSKQLSFAVAEHSLTALLFAP